MTDLEVPARDGYPLSATWLTGGRRVVVINSATAVPRRFYRHFAEHLRDAGYSVLTYDYRGIGGSRPKTLRGFPARMRDWALQDM
ncbi:MAG: alpha/beta hydrolase, partial [Myxococcota bacterium]